jgi:hypothetical protein
MATLFGLRLFAWKEDEPPAALPCREGSPLFTFSAMVESGELDASDAEERFEEIWARAEACSKSGNAA